MRMTSKPVRRLIGLLSASALVVTVLVASLPAVTSATATSCTQTGFFRDSINMTAAQIGGNVTGSLDAGGCNIGVYYGSGKTGTVKGATVKNANYYGIVNDGGSVSVSNSTVTGKPGYSPPPPWRSAAVSRTSNHN